jgi:Tol biopolymer transport system component
MEIGPMEHLGGFVLISLHNGQTHMKSDNSTLLYRERLFPRLLICSFLLLLVISLAGCQSNKMSDGIINVAPRGIPPSQSIVWSPINPDQVLVTSSNLGPGAEVYILNIKTKDRKVIAHTESGSFFEAKWTPDGKDVLILVGENVEAFSPQGWWKVNINGKSAEYLLGFVTAAWSPDGKTIATFSEEQQNGQFSKINLKLINVDTHREEIIFTSTELDTASNLSWSPDGQYLTFALGKSQLGDLHILNVSTEEFVNITEDQMVDSPVWSPTGKIIGFENRSQTEFRITLHLISLDGKCNVEIPNLENAISPTWSPDGKKLGYIAEDGIYIIELDKIFGRDITNDICS